ncbi:MAG TPA: ATP-binding cassette domain-containing protein [Syntrophomonadaceae bacterium]|nr:ATP-binding cassette domain-containing protein [Syntrophomonadaceae bacterium]
MKEPKISRIQKDSILAVEDLSFAYPNGLQVLRGVCMEVGKGSRTVILGANGAGKSTLFLHLNGILKPQQGRAFLEGRPIAYDRRSLAELRRKVGIVFQDPDSQLFSVNVFQDISFGPMNLKCSPSEVRDRVEEAMELTQITGLRQRPTHQLSYGEKKRVAIAGVLAMNPEVIILDEPTAFLDPALVEDMMALLANLHKAGNTLIMSTHDMDLAYRWADQCYVLNQGCMVAGGLPRDIFMNKELLKENNLHIPWILKVYSELASRGLFEEVCQPPRSEEQLFAGLSKQEKSSRMGSPSLRAISHL